MNFIIEDEFYIHRTYLDRNLSFRINRCNFFRNKDNMRGRLTWNFLYSEVRKRFVEKLH